MIRIAVLISSAMLLCTSARAEPILPPAAANSGLPETSTQYASPNEAAPSLLAAPDLLQDEQAIADTSPVSSVASAAHKRLAHRKAVRKATHVAKRRPIIVHRIAVAPAPAPAQYAFAAPVPRMLGCVTMLCPQYPLVGVGF